MLRNKKKYGYVYIASNKGMPGLVKIGMTSNAPAKRLKELYTTGVPYPFKLHYARRLKDPRGVEKHLHSVFERYRVSKKREFFVIDAQDAIRITEKSVRNMTAAGRSGGTLWLIVIILIMVMLFLLHRYYGVPVISDWINATMRF